MFRRRDDLKRRRWIVPPRPRVLVCCEGLVTEPSYFNSLKREGHNRLLHVEIQQAGPNPKTLVDFAVELKKREENTARRQKDDNLKYNEVWCVFDVDSHSHIADARQKAAANGVRVAISNPCFELWLLLHFQEQNAHIERDRAQSACREHMPEYRKEVPFDTLFSRYQEAVQRSLTLEHWQETRGCAGENPSTDVHRLTERIMELGREELLKKHRRAERQ